VEIPTHHYGSPISDPHIRVPGELLVFVYIERLPLELEILECQRKLLQTLLEKPKDIFVGFMGISTDVCDNSRLSFSSSCRFGTLEVVWVAVCYGEITRSPGVFMQGSRLGAWEYRLTTGLIRNQLVEIHRLPCLPVASGSTRRDALAAQIPTLSPPTPPPA
jgi:hypothetical protein